ncbi:EAL domain-containing protein [Burkholderiaceae bacterium DAT-1]|nr:EAL domain-containing protein [Burkholderiaceae bacterium DAT-1]
MTHSLFEPALVLVCASILPWLKERRDFDPFLRHRQDVLLLGAVAAIFAALQGTCLSTGDVRQFALAIVVQWAGIIICTPAILSALIRSDSYLSPSPKQESHISHLTQGGDIGAWHMIAVNAGSSLLIVVLAWINPVVIGGLPLLALFPLLWTALHCSPSRLYESLLIQGSTVLSVIMINMGHATLAPDHVIWEIAELLMAGGIALLAGSAIYAQRLLTHDLLWDASHDHLTKLINRAELERQLGEMPERPDKSDVQDAFCLIDLDKFRIVNDTFGHRAGDLLITALARHLKIQTRPQDSLARMGGDEFGILIRQIDTQEAIAIAERYCDAIEHFRFHWEGKPISLEASAGLVMLEGQRQQAHPIAAADTACLLAKQGGTHRLVVYTDDNEDLMRHRAMLAWVPQIRQALADNRLKLYCQIISPIQQGHGTLSFEILVRMFDEKGTMMPPGDFIPPAERFGIMPALDLWVVGETLGWLNRWPVLWPLIEHCSINISGASIGEPDFRNAFTRLISQPGIPREKLCFEITETAAISHLERAAEFVGTLRELGARTALDDFGVGLSSFSYLKHLPVDFIKIDGSFIKNILDSPIDDAMVRSIFQVAKAMGVGSIAEYVENAEVMQRLRNIGIEFGQGWHFGKPVPIDEFFVTAMEGAILGRAA